MSDFVRVYSKESKAAFNYSASADLEGLDVIEGAETVDAYGQPLPTEYGLDRKPANKPAAAAKSEEKK